MKQRYFTRYISAFCLAFAGCFHVASAKDVEVVVTIEEYKALNVIGFSDIPYVEVNINNQGFIRSENGNKISKNDVGTPKPNEFRRIVDPLKLNNSNVPIVIKMRDFRPVGNDGEININSIAGVNDLSLIYNLVSKKLDIESPQTGSGAKFNLGQYTIYYKVESTDLNQIVDNMGTCGTAVIGARASDRLLTDTGVNYIYTLKNSNESTFNIISWSLDDYEEFSNISSLFPSGGIKPGNNIQFERFSALNPRTVEIVTKVLYNDNEQTERPVVVCAAAGQKGPESLSYRIISVDMDDKNRCGGKKGTLLVEAEFTNKDSSRKFTNLFFEQAELTGNNHLCAVRPADVFGNERVEPAQTREYQDGELSPAERVSVTFYIGLETLNKFRFLVNAFALNKLLDN